MKARPGLLIYRRKGMGLVLAVDEAGTVTVMWTRPGGFEPRLTTYSSDGWKWVLAVNEPVNIWVPAESTRSAPNSGMNALTTDGNAGQKTQDRAEAEPSSTPEERERERHAENRRARLGFTLRRNGRGELPPAPVPPPPGKHDRATAETVGRERTDGGKDGGKGGAGREAGRGTRSSQARVPASEFRR